MAILNTILDTLRQSTALQVVVAICVVLLYPAAQAIINLYFHPLSNFPGPKLWAGSRLPFIYCLLNGKLVKRERELHEKYGEIIRLAPDEVSFANEEAWNEIYNFRRGHKRTVRDKAYYVAPNDQADNLITTSDPKFHGRVRGLMSNSFTEDSLRNQHPLIHQHADMLVDKLRQLAIGPQSSMKSGVLVNLTDWLNFFTMDVIGDLAFGQPFGCLEAGEYHSWVRTLFSYLKGMSLAAAPRYYPLTERLFMKLIPQSVLEGQRQHTEYANERILRRLELRTDRPDFMTPFLRNNANFEHMSKDEILSTFNFIIVGGSETTATTLTGIFNHLCKNERILTRLCAAIRRRYSKEEDITIDSIHDLPYLEAVLNEGLRMCNPIPGGLPRMVPDGGDTYCGKYLPGGTRLAVRTFTVNRSAKYFTDPDEFVPERWLPNGERPARYDNDRLTASKPFSVGFHSCLGRPLAWAELRLVVTRLLWAFDFAEEPTCRVSFDDFPVIMLIQKEPMMLRVRLRSNQATAAKD